MVSFVDTVKIFLTAGDGGNGSMSIRREKYKPFAGPDGGNGGDGGSIYIVAKDNVFSLLDLKFAPHRRAKNGKHGMGGNKNGANADDLVLYVPIGTTVESEDGKILADLVRNDSAFLAAKGGIGGLGNAALAGSTHKAPHFALLGTKGEDVILNLELKLIADVALIGFPSSGKSSLISVLSKAKPKIADYPFTTLVPNLGVVSAANTRYTISDIPGLIPGASEGKGLGLDFLRHVRRASVLAHVVDMGSYDPDRDPVGDIKAIEHELSKYSKNLEDEYREKLSEEIKKKVYGLTQENEDEIIKRIVDSFLIPFDERPRIIILNKMDLPDSKDLRNIVYEDLKQFGWPIFETSAVTKTGLKELSIALGTIVDEQRAEIRKKVNSDFMKEFSSIENEHIEIKYKDKNKKEFDAEYVVDDDGNKFYRVTGEKINKWVEQTDFQNEEAVQFLDTRLAKIGVNKALVDMGIQSNDEVRIGSLKNNVVFDWKNPEDELNEE